MQPVHILRLLLGALLLAVGLAAVPSGVQARATDDGPPHRHTAGPPADHGRSGAGFQRACDPSPGPDRASCQSLIRTDLAPLTSVRPGRKPPGLNPYDIHSAYNLPWRPGKGRTVAVVVAFDYPTAEHDLGVYRRQFGLPRCTTANGCFRKDQPERRHDPAPAGRGREPAAR